MASRPSEAEPDGRLRGLLAELAEAPGTSVVIVSGRSRQDLEQWFGGLDVGLAAEHGAWLREAGADWRAVGLQPDPQWKDAIRPILERHADRTPGSSIEEKDWALAWHYRRSDPELAAIRVAELKEALRELTANLDLAVLEGDRVMEVKSASVDKGRAAAAWLAHGPWDFVLAMGDDQTDEDTFGALPAEAWTIRVGPGPTRARFALESVREARGLLEQAAVEGRRLSSGEGLMHRNTA